MNSGKKPIGIKDRLAQAAGNTVAWYVATTAGVISGTLAIVDDVLDISTRSKRPSRTKNK